MGAEIGLACVYARKAERVLRISPYCSDKNYTDNSLEVKDSSGEVVFQTVLIGSTAHIQGIWRDQFGAGEELATDDGADCWVRFLWSLTIDVVDAT